MSCMKIVQYCSSQLIFFFFPMQGCKYLILFLVGAISLKLLVPRNCFVDTISHLHGCCSATFGLASSLNISMDVKVGKEDYEGDGISNEAVVHPLGEVAVNVQRVSGMDDGQGELKL